VNKGSVELPHCRREQSSLCIYPACGRDPARCFAPNPSCVTTANLLDLVATELASARQKFPPFNSAHEGYAVVLEELDELWTEIRSNQATAGRNERMTKEAIQVAAMALRFLVDLPGFKN
jgi:hypothetical protein